MEVYYAILSSGVFKFSTIKSLRTILCIEFLAGAQNAVCGSGKGCSGPFSPPGAPADPSPPTGR